MPSKRPRSPKHPSHGLEAAIAKIDGVFQSHGASEFDAAALATAMGYDSPRGGTALAWISTLKQYELIDTPSQGTHRVSDLAKDVLLAQGEEQLSALVSAADSPPLFKQIRKQFAGTKTPEQKPLELWLQRQDFTSSAASKCARVYLDTERFMGLKLAQEKRDPAPQGEATAAPEEPKPEVNPAPTMATPEISGVLYDGNAFTLTSLKPLTQEDFEAIKTLLDAQKMVAPSREPAQSAAGATSDAAG